MLISTVVEDLVERITRGNPTEVKVVLTSVVLALACYQLVLIAVGYGKVRPSFLRPQPATRAHRAAGDAIGVMVARGADAHGYLEPPAAGKVVLSVPSPEGLAREAGEVRRVIARAGTGVEPLVVVVEAAEALGEDELGAILDAAGHTPAQ